MPSPGTPLSSKKSLKRALLGTEAAGLAPEQLNSPALGLAVRG